MTPRSLETLLLEFRSVVARSDIDGVVVRREELAVVLSAIEGQVVEVRGSSTAIHIDIKV